MPCDYRIDPERRLIVSTGHGRLTFAEIMEHRNGFMSDPAFDPSFSQLADLRDVTELDLSIDEARLLASSTIFSPSSRRAFVAPHPAVFGMFRLMEAYHSIAEISEHVAIFRDEESAVQWIEGRDLQ